MLLSRGREGYRPGWPMGARGSGQHRPSAPAHGDLALSCKEKAKKFLLPARRASVRGRCSHCNSATAGRCFRFPCGCPGARKSSAAWTKKKGAYLRARGGGARRRPRAPASTTGWKLVPGPECLPPAETRAELEAAGPRWARQGSARSRRRWGCCCARCWGTRARPRAAASRRWGRLLGSALSTSVRLRAAASGTSWTAVASDWRAFPSRFRPGSLGCKCSSNGRRGNRLSFGTAG